ncbi:unnamed protein product [Schistocephalus solidus]|uniref:TPR_REGION domain-containing protein n=1 Tax=Schistocephalus solidus TaxID=70667 RepID=A0A183TKT1_SCHSO|nr:unnamed protein product [Schistocephalus solidus]
MACASEDFEGGGLNDVPQLTPSCLHAGFIIWSMHVLQFLGYLVAEIKTVSRQDIVQQLPAPRLRMHPRGLLPRRKTEEGVGQQETVFRTGLRKKKAVIVAATETMGTQHSLPDSVICPNAGVEVAKNNQLIRLRQEGVRALVEFEGRFDDAIEHYTTALRLAPENPLLYTNRALALIKACRFASAESDCSTALALDPRHVKALYRPLTNIKSIQTALI